MGGRVCAIACLVLVLGACSPGAPPPRGLVLVCIDTLRADHLGAYGYPRPTSPRIDALAREAILFRNTLAPSPWTLPSVATLMTSQYPSIHGAQSPSNLDDLEWLHHPKRYRPFSALHSSRTTLAELLRDAGYATYAGVQGSYVSTAFGFEQGFDVYHQNRTPGVRFDIEDALAWLDERQPDRFFVYLHVGEVHSPYTPIAMPRLAAELFEADRIPYFETALEQEQSRFAAIDFDPDYTGFVDGSRESLARLRRGRVSKRDLDHLVALYDRGIAYTDYWIGRLLDALAQRGLDDETLFVLTADHGEEFIEHGGLEHNYSYYEEMLRVPLIIRVPQHPAATVDSTVGLIDVLPTVLDLLGLAQQTQRPEIMGSTLRPLWNDGVDSPDRDYLGQASFVHGLTAIRSGRWKYIHHAPTKPGEKAHSELYDLIDDPDEKTNQCNDHKPRCLQLARKLEARNAELAATAERLALPDAEAAHIDPATAENLRQLGYLDDDPPKSPAR